jgi:hypothetical protein
MENSTRNARTRQENNNEKDESDEVLARSLVFAIFTNPNEKPTVQAARLSSIHYTTVCLTSMLPDGTEQ